MTEGDSATRPLRFCHITTFYPPYNFGGDGILVQRLSHALARAGHEVDVIHCVDSYFAMKGKEPEFVADPPSGVRVHSMRSGAGVLSPFLSQQTGGTWFKTGTIRAVLQSKRFDVIHYHNVSLLGPRVLRLQPGYSGFVKLYTSHEHWLVCPMHVLWKDNQRLCDTPQCFRCTLRYRRPPQWWRYSGRLRSCTAAVDAFIAPSEFCRTMHSQRGFKPDMQVLPHFVPEPTETSTDSTSPPLYRRPYFLYVGRLEKIKGVDTLLPVFHSYPHADLLIAGSGTQEAQLRSRAGSLGNILFLGSLPQHQLLNYYRNAIATIVPTVGYETFGMVILESFLQGTPVIASARGSFLEIIASSGGGFVYHDSVELQTAMEKLRNDVSLRTSLGEAGRAECRRRWSESVHLSQYLRIIEVTGCRKYGQWPQPGTSGAVNASH